MAIVNLQEFQDHSLIKNSPALQRVLSVFDRMTSHARPSGQEGAVRAELIDIAKSQGWEVKQDEIGNVAFVIPATPGREDTTHVVIQGHMDIVTTPADRDLPRSAEIVLGDSGKPNDPGNDLWMQTVGRTMTLGADNGIGVSTAMATMMDPDLQHGPVTILVTVDEETGMSGAKKLDSALIPQTGILINGDSEEGPEGICIGCAGGVDIVGKFPIVDREVIPPDYDVVDIDFSGFVGGHSGVEIHRGRGNAIQSMANLLIQIQSTGCDLRLINFNGGTARNAIPSTAKVTLALPKDQMSNVKSLIETFLQELKRGVSPEDPEITGELIAENAQGIAITLFSHEAVDASLTSISTELRNRICSLLQELPQGPITSASLPHVGRLVTLSNNVGVIKTHNNAIEVVSMARAAHIEALRLKMAQIQEMLASRGAELDVEKDPSSGWLEDPTTSAAVALAFSSVEQVLGKGETKLMAYHAGLESGIISGKVPGISAVSMGPLILEAHTPRERVNLHSVNQVLQVIRNMVSNVDAVPAPVQEEVKQDHGAYVVQL